MSIKKYELGEFNNNVRDAKLLFISSSVYEDDFLSSMHYHPFTEIFYVKSGKGHMCIENNKIPLTENMMIIINPYIQHTEFSDKKNPLEYYIIGASRLSIENKLSQVYTAFNYKNSENEILKCFDSIISEIKDKKHAYQNICQNLFENLLLYASRDSKINYNAYDMRRANRVCDKIRQYIEANYKNKISLDLLAGISNLNKYYLSHQFNNIYGISPMNYLNNIRLEACKDLLKNTSYSIEDISLMTGFSSRAYMAQSFKKACKITAMEYRKRAGVI